MSLFKHQTQIQKEFDNLYNRSKNIVSGIGSNAVNTTKKVNSQKTTTTPVIGGSSSPVTRGASTNTVIITGSDYTVLTGVNVIVATDSLTITLPPATGTGRELAIKCRKGTTTIRANSVETIMGGNIVEIYEGETLVIVDTQSKRWE